MNQQESKKSNFGCIGGGCLLLVVGGLITLLPVFMVIYLGASGIIFNNEKFDQLKEEAKKILSNFGDLSNILSGYSLTHGDMNDLHPLNPDITGGENTCADCHIEVSTDPPKRSEASDWQYTNFTYPEETNYWDVDFSKFSKPLKCNNDDYEDNAGDDETSTRVPEYLFQWHVNNYNDGKQRFTIEHIHSGTVEDLRTTFDESSRNDSFVTNKDKSQQYLDLGDYLFSAQDSRIMSAFAPIVTAGNISGLLTAKGWFHRGDVWTGSNARGFEGVSLWRDDVGRGTFIDVVFEDNITHKQLVVPFIYSDAKDLHWFNSSGQRIDQRYGQCVARIEKSGTNGTVQVEVPTLKCKLVKYFDAATTMTPQDLQLYYIGQAKAIEEINKGRHDSSKYALANFLVAGDEYILQDWGKELFKDGDISKPLYFELTDGTIGGLGECVQETGTEDVQLYSDDDAVYFNHMTSLELIDIWSSKETLKVQPRQDMNFYIAQALLTGRIWDGTTQNKNPNWSLVSMRVYPNKKIPDRDFMYHEFTDYSKTLERIDEIPQNNKVIEFIHGEDCVCTMCLKIAR